MEKKRNPLGISDSRIINSDGTVKDGLKGFDYAKYNKEIMKHNIKHLRGLKAKKKEELSKKFDDLASDRAGYLIRKAKDKKYFFQGNLNGR